MHLLKCDSAFISFTQFHMFFAQNDKKLPDRSFDHFIRLFYYFYIRVGILSVSDRIFGIGNGVFRTLMDTPQAQDTLFFDPFRTFVLDPDRMDRALPCTHAAPDARFIHCEIFGFTALFIRFGQLFLLVMTKMIGQEDSFFLCGNLSTHFSISVSALCSACSIYERSVISKCGFQLSTMRIHNVESRASPLFFIALTACSRNCRRSYRRLRRHTHNDRFHPS